METRCFSSLTHVCFFFASFGVFLRGKQGLETFLLGKIWAK